MKIILKAIFSVVVMIFLCWVLDRRWGNFPPAGRICSPVTGFWQNSEAAGPVIKQTIHTNELGSTVTVEYDRHMIPHIFAKNDADLYFAQGYITARDRLWQMELQARVAAGRISEILGRKGIGHDQYARFMGIDQSAQSSLQALFEDSVMEGVVRSYTAGVNAWIRSLSARDYPLEFKMLDFRPEEWSSQKCSLMFKWMALTLAGQSDDFQLSNTFDILGRSRFDQLFPEKSAVDVPVIPSGTRWNFSPVPPPVHLNPGTGANNVKYGEPKNDNVGSNSWAISGERSASGFPLLANDPHLSLTLPSIWYQVQLITPDMNVYGVSIPGVPCVVIGFNQYCAWGMTNAYIDVSDWYKLRFKDEKANEYWYEGHWNTIGKRIERIKVRGSKDITDTMLYACHGPVLLKDRKKDIVQGSHGPEKEGFALRWIAHERSTELKALYMLNRCRNYADYRKALSFYTSPAQNFLFASADNHIAVTTGGKIPIRYHDQGRFILDGTGAVDDWHGFIPAEQNPSSEDPSRGFLCSANQLLTDSSYPYYLGAAFSSSYRARRIENRLKNLEHATVDSFRLMQNDTYNVMAADVTHMLVSELSIDGTATYAQARDEIASWDYRFEKTSIAPTIFNAWWDLLYTEVWRNVFGGREKDLKWPGNEETISFLSEHKDSCRELINRTFSHAVDSLAARFGPFGKRWAWGSTRQCRISHVAGNAFSIGPFAAGGCSNTIDAMSPGFGPSWRMIVQLGPKVKGYGTLPGGESGNPGSPYYDDLFPTWEKGQLEELLYLKNVGEAPTAIRSTLTFNK